MVKQITTTGQLLITFAALFVFRGSGDSSTIAESTPHLRVGAGTAEIVGEDSMVIGGGIGPGKLTGREGKLLATAVVLCGSTERCGVGGAVLVVYRGLLDEA